MNDVLLFSVEVSSSEEAAQLGYRTIEVIVKINKKNSGKGLAWRRKKHITIKGSGVLFHFKSFWESSAKFEFLVPSLLD